jgi:hypothetical protein
MTGASKSGEVEPMNRPVDPAMGLPEFRSLFVRVL